MRNARSFRPAPFPARLAVGAPLPAGHLQAGHPRAHRLDRFQELLFVVAWSVRKTAVQRVAWAKVLEIEPHHVRLDVKALDTPAFDWERWLRDHFVAKAEAKPK